jgi:beta-lactamase class A
MTESTVTASLAEAFQGAMADYFGDLSGPVGVMVEVLGSDQALTWNHTGVFPTASTLKIPLLYELYRQVDAGQVDLKERVTLRHAGRVPGSGVYQHLDDGLTPTVRDLAELMITVSDNWATDILFGRLGKDSVASTLADLGLTQTFLPLTIHELFCALAGLDQADPAAEYEALRDFLKTYNPEPDSVGLAADSRNDVSSPADMVRLMALIDAGHGLTPASRDAMIEILKHQNFTSIIPARLPTDQQIETAHKTGSLRGIKNDVGIVYSPKVSYAIAFMSRQQEDIPEVVDRMARASRWVWDRLSTEV